MYVEKLKDFTTIPRHINKDFFEGKMNLQERNLLLSIFLSTDPFYGYYLTSYRELVEEFREKGQEIKKVNQNIRKIISNLRKKKYIWFPNHRGKKDFLTIYPMGFRNTQKWMHFPEEFDFVNFKEKGSTSVHNSDTPNHNTAIVYKPNSLQTEPLKLKPEEYFKNPFTPPYIETENEINNLD